MNQSEGHLISNVNGFTAHVETAITTTAKLINFAVCGGHKTREMICQSESDFAISCNDDGPWFKVTAGNLFSIPVVDANAGKVFVKSLSGTIEVQFIAWIY